MTFSLSLVTQSTELTESGWPSSGSPCGAPVAASQSLTVSSSEPDATSLPSGEKATELTQSGWPSSGSLFCNPSLLLFAVDYNRLSSHPLLLPILRRILHCRPCLHLSIRLIHEQDGSKTHRGGVPTNGGGEWLGPRGP